MPPKKFKCAFHFKEPDREWCLECQKREPRYCIKKKCPKFGGYKNVL